MKPSLKQLEPQLHAIIDAEIAAGNAVTQLSLEWPRAGKLCVLLKYRFKLQHKMTGTSLQYFEDHDPHGPVAEYVHLPSGQSVMCSLFP